VIKEELQIAKATVKNNKISNSLVFSVYGTAYISTKWYSQYLTEREVAGWQFLSHSTTAIFSPFV